MSEIRCPMCGKLNPAELEVCQFCEARLKPLKVPPAPDESAQTGQEQNHSYRENEAESEAEPTNWLSGLREDEVSREGEPQEESQSEFEAEATEWLSRIQIDADSDMGTEEEDHEPIPPVDWSPEGELTDQVEFPDWLTGLRSDSEQPIESWDEEEVSQQESEVPEWLQRLRERQTDDTEQELEPQFPPEENIEQASELSVDETIPQASGDEDEIAGRQIEEDVVPEESGEAGVDDSHFPFEEVPDWRSEEVTEEAESQTSDQSENEPEWDGSEEKEDIPRWLKELSGKELSDDEEELFPEGEPVATPGSSPDTVGDVFDVVKEEEKAGIQEEELEQVSPLPEEGELPDWLKEPAANAEEIIPESRTGDDFPEEESSEVPVGEEDEIELVHASDLPDWLGKEFSEEEQPEELAQEPELSPAVLPSWLEAMRPVEDAAPKAPIEPDTPDDNLETAGPLAGLRGVLSAPIEIARVQKPPTYSAKIHVTDSQRSHAELLKNMIAKEGKSQPFLRSPVISPQLILRWTIALVLLLAVLWPIITGSQGAMLPIYTPETSDVNRIINDLPADSRVLLAFDYQPGLSGEMDAAASAVIDHLMLRGAYLTLVSTSTSGPIVGEHFLQKTQAAHDYTNGIQYINLGYIPGGPSGLLSFAENPQNTLPYTLESQSAWESAGNQALPPLQGIHGILDFSMVMVMTDNPDTARAWIEQVQPHLISEDKSTPLIMVASAQAEPLIRPYYESNPKQIQGLIAGLQGGAAYSRLTGRGELPRKYWDAFSLGLIIAAMLIIAGGIFTTMVTALQGDKRVEGQEKI